MKNFTPHLTTSSQVKTQIYSSILTAWFVCFFLKSPQINRFIGTFHLQIFHTSLRIPVMCCSMKIENTRSSNIGPKHMIFELKNIYFILCVWVFWLHVCLCTTCVQSLRRPDESSEWLGVGDTERCEPLCRQWELNQSPLDERSMLLPPRHLPTLDVCTVYRRPSLPFTKRGLKCFKVKIHLKFFKCRGEKFGHKLNRNGSGSFPRSRREHRSPCISGFCLAWKGHSRYQTLCCFLYTLFDTRYVSEQWKIKIWK